MSRGMRHSASDHMSGDRPGGARQAMMAADRPHAGRDYAWRGARCIILRSGDIAVRNTPAAGRCVRVCAFVTSDGIGGTDGFGGTVPLFVTSDGIGGTDGFGGTVPLGDGRGRVVAGPGSGCGAAGSGMASSLGTWGSVAASSATAGWRPAGTLRRRMGGRAAASRRPAGPASAAGARGPGRPLSRWPYGRHRRVHASWTACGVLAAALWRDDQRQHQAGSGPPALLPRRRWHSSCHRCRRPRSWPGSLHQAPASSAGTRHFERHGHQRS